MAHAEATGLEVRIATVDDHPLIRFAIKSLIQDRNGWNIVAECDTPNALRSILAIANPNVVVIDLLFAEESGLDLLEYMDAFHPEIYTIVYSMRNEKHYALRCFRSGATGYVCKSEPPAAIIAAIERVLAGGRYASEELAGIAAQAGKADGRLDLLCYLSNRELEVFQYIGAGMETRQIATAICRSPKTVETYRYRIKKKLGLANSVELIQLACIHVNGYDARLSHDRSETPKSRD